MSELTEEQRQEIADKICEQVRDWVMNPDYTVELTVLPGVETSPNPETGYMDADYNETWTMEIRVNGGARDTESGPMTNDPLAPQQH